MAESGIGSSGTGAVLSSLTPSLVGSQVASLRTNAYNLADSQARSDIASQLGVLKDLGPEGPSRTQNAMAEGIHGFAPYLNTYLQTKYPTYFPRSSQAPVAAAR